MVVKARFTLPLEQVQDFYIGAICTPEEYEKNLKLDFSKIIREKMGINYVPYAHIIRALHQNVTGCTYGFEKNPEDGGIIWYTPNNNAYVQCYLTRRFHEDRTDVRTPAGFFPISNMRKRHVAIVSPDIREIDNCVRRAIAKEIGMHTGIGMSLWADSDPYDEDDENQPVSTESADAQEEKISQAAFEKEFMQRVTDGHLNKLGVATLLHMAHSDSIKKIPEKYYSNLLKSVNSDESCKFYNQGRDSKGNVIISPDAFYDSQETESEQTLDELSDAVNSIM